jgi:predicted nucleic acid-binding protein
MILIDTSAWIEFLRRQGDPVTKSRVAAYVEMGEAAYCGPIELELRLGARSAEIEDVNAALGFSTYLDFPRSCWERAAGLEKRLRASGVTVPRDDIFVATAGLHHGVAIFAVDLHFAAMRDKGDVPLRLL